MAYVHLHDFRNELDEEILERGYFYFKNGWVKKITEIMPGCFEAVIEEANPHAITYSFNEQGKFADVFCSCGDTKHIFCRHAAAILYHYETLAELETGTMTWEDLENKPSR